MPRRPAPLPMVLVPYDSGAWDVVLAPRGAVPDAPRCSPELVCWPARSSSLPRGRIAQNCTVRLAANSPSIRTSSDSAAWNGGAEGSQVLGHPPRMTLDCQHKPTGRTGSAPGAPVACASLHW
eukprot:scaffold71258_cov36-Phaeocystis_antarctica.AAC.2